MSRSALVTEEAVKEALQIDSFRNLSKDKIMQFASMIPNMDKDVAISIINQFPSYAESAISMVEQLKNTCDSAIEANKDSNAVFCKCKFLKFADKNGEFCISVLEKVAGCPAGLPDAS